MAIKYGYFIMLWLGMGRHFLGEGGAAETDAVTPIIYKYTYNTVFSWWGEGALVPRCRAQPSLRVVSTFDGDTVLIQSNRRNWAEQDGIAFHYTTSGFD